MKGIVMISAKLRILLVFALFSIGVLGFYLTRLVARFSDVATEVGVGLAVASIVGLVFIIVIQSLCLIFRSKWLFVAVVAIYFGLGALCGNEVIQVVSSNRESLDVVVAMKGVVLIFGLSVFGFVGGLLHLWFLRKGVPRISAANE